LHRLQYSISEPGLSPICTWFILYLYLLYPLSVLGLLKNRSWFSCLYLVCPQSLSGLSPICTWSISYLWMVYHLAVPGLSFIYSWSPPNLYLVYPLSLPGLSPTFSWFIPYLHLVHVPYLYSVYPLSFLRSPLFSWSTPICTCLSLICTWSIPYLYPVNPLSVPGLSLI
jgi:hypothetical protein